ncbi:MAG TPA: hypothetical protein VIL85_23105 [Thermomicrobiales bacterium]|jgi:hypothetical protein
MIAPIIAVDDEVELPRIAVGYCPDCGEVAPGVPELVTRADGDRRFTHRCE